MLVRNAHRQCVVEYVSWPGSYFESNRAHCSTNSFATFINTVLAVVLCF